MTHKNSRKTIQRRRYDVVEIIDINEPDKIWYYDGEEFGLPKIVKSIHNAMLMPHSVSEFVVNEVSSVPNLIATERSVRVYVEPRKEKTLECDELILNEYVEVLNNVCKDFHRDLIHFSETESKLMEIKNDVYPLYDGKALVIEDPKSDIQYEYIFSIPCLIPKNILNEEQTKIIENSEIYELVKLPANNEVEEFWHFKREYCEQYRPKSEKINNYLMLTNTDILNPDDEFLIKHLQTLDQLFGCEKYQDYITYKINWKLLQSRLQHFVDEFRIQFGEEWSERLIDAFNEDDEDCDFWIHFIELMS